LEVVDGAGGGDGEGQGGGGGGVGEGGDAEEVVGGEGKLEAFHFTAEGFDEAANDGGAVFGLLD